MGNCQSHWHSIYNLSSGYVYRQSTFCSITLLLLWSVSSSCTYDRLLIRPQAPLVLEHNMVPDCQFLLQKVSPDDIRIFARCFRPKLGFRARAASTKYLLRVHVLFVRSWFSMVQDGAPWT